MLALISSHKYSVYVCVMCAGINHVYCMHNVYCMVIVLFACVLYGHCTVCVCTVWSLYCLRVYCMVTILFACVLYGHYTVCVCTVWSLYCLRVYCMVTILGIVLCSHLRSSYIQYCRTVKSVSALMSMTFSWKHSWYILCVFVLTN